MSLEQSFDAARVADANGETTQSIPKAGYVLVVEDDAAMRQMVTACSGRTTSRREAFPTGKTCSSAASTALNPA